MSHVSNVRKTDKPYGQILEEISMEIARYLNDPDIKVCVRERGFFRFAAETQILYRVVGLSDYIGWVSKGAVFQEIAPMSIKSVVAGNTKASKQQIADALVPYVGEQSYRYDDESDAVAVGITWLIQNGYLNNI